MPKPKGPSPRMPKPKGPSPRMPKPKGPSPQMPKPKGPSPQAPKLIILYLFSFCLIYIHTYFQRDSKTKKKKEYKKVLRHGIQPG